MARRMWFVLSTSRGRRNSPLELSTNRSCWRSRLTREAFSVNRSRGSTRYTRLFCRTRHFTGFSLAPDQA